MKTLELKAGEIKEGCFFCGDPTPPKVKTYAELIRGCLDDQGRGLTFKDLKERFRIEKVLDASNGKLVLEDADADVLKKLMNSMRWGIRSSFVLQFCTDVEAL